MTHPGGARRRGRPVARSQSPLVGSQNHMDRPPHVLPHDTGQDGNHHATEMIRMT